MHRYAQSGNHSNERPGYVIDLNGLCSLISKLKIRVSVVRLIRIDWMSILTLRAHFVRLSSLCELIRPWPPNA